MKATELLNNALKMLGYSDSDGNAELTQRIVNGAIVVLNLVYSDLWHTFNTGDFTPIKNLDDNINIPPNVLYDTFLYGVAMHIARNENDGDQQQYFAALYNAKRAGLTRYDKVKNTLPRPQI